MEKKKKKKKKIFNHIHKQSNVCEQINDSDHNREINADDDSEDGDEDEDQLVSKRNYLIKFGLTAITIFLLIVSISTTITLLIIIYRLRLIPGFEYFTITDDGDIVFHRDTYIDRIQLQQNQIDDVESITGNVALESGSSSLRINRDGIELRSRSGLEVRCPKTGKILFPFDISSIPLDSIKTLSVPNGIGDVKMIRSPIDKDLVISSTKKLNFRGNKGIHLEGKKIRLEANKIYLSSKNSNIILDGKKGVYLNMERFKNKIITEKQPFDASKLQYKLCVCGKNGRLFKMAVKDQSSSCSDARFPESDNPCI
ncbi:sarcoglycan-like protein [Sarcoptes scabiei]|uniref:Beta-sarcoglycan n=1 Tax=Sarcoptes scabiei TaxID=52283 RepID=A0A132AJ09_SARSC|nr:sarcoglycan-like protein [Sarcoptes scabiei]